MPIIHKQKGFLLVEVVVAISLFVIIIGMSLGSIISILDSSRRFRGNKDMMDNLNASIEYMTRTVRFGYNYHCGTSTPLTTPLDCPSGGTQLAVNFKGQTLVYKLEGSQIKLSEDGGSTFKLLTASNVIIDHLSFRTYGALKTDNPPVQPYVWVVIRGRVASDSSSNSAFDIQTVMTQRKLDLNI